MGKISYNRYRKIKKWRGGRAEHEPVQASAVSKGNAGGKFGMGSAHIKKSYGYGWKAIVVFFLFCVFFCAVFTDLALKKKGQGYDDLLGKSRQRFGESGGRALLEELLPVYDFLDYGSSDSSLFAELSEAVMPGQQYLARECFERHKTLRKRLSAKRHWTKEDSADGETAGNGNVVLDYDEMVYNENRRDAQEALSSSNEVSFDMEKEVFPEAGEEDHQSVEYIAAESYYEDTLSNILTENEMAEQLLKNEEMIKTLKEKKSTSYLLSNFYIVDGSTNADKKKFRVDTLLKKDMTMEKTETKESPQIMIYHTHASEEFLDSREGNYEDTVVGVGAVLADILKNTYGYQVYHDTTRYDIVNGSLDRNKAYNQAAVGIEKALKKYPSIEVIIDLHRDSGSKRVTTINGKKTAQIMLFNGISRNKNGDIGYLHNPNLRGNLAFSLQMKLAAMSLYPDFAKPIYIKGYRYNLHYKEKSLLIELGTDRNTLEEAMNAMEPLARVLDQVLSGKQGS